ncbi:MAG: hypothetical protein ACREJN_09225 [Nitrospiraceae bacterium]
MVPIHKVVGVLSCGVLLWFGLSNVAQASVEDDFIRGQTDQKRLSVRATSGHAIHGLVLSKNGDTLVVKQENGEKVLVYIDQTTYLTGRSIDPGDLIDARVNEKNHALTIFSAQ